ncbi:MAG: Nif11-like leader peptide family RiPP precursor [Desulfitobacteriaceae bacterium]
MSEGLKQLAAKVQADENLQKRFKACKSSEEQAALAKELGFAVSAADFEKASELSDDQVDQVAGGSCVINIFIG